MGVKYEEWDLPTLQNKIPVADFRSFYPPRRPEDPNFLEEMPGRQVTIAHIIANPDKPLCERVGLSEAEAIT